MSSADIFVKFLGLYDGHYVYNNIDSYSPVDANTIRIHTLDGNDFDFSYYSDDDYSLVYRELETEEENRKHGAFIKRLQKTVAVVLLIFILGSYACGGYALCEAAVDTYKMSTTLKVEAIPVEVDVAIAVETEAEPTEAIIPETEVPMITETPEETYTKPIDISTEPSEESPAETQPQPKPKPTTTNKTEDTETVEVNKSDLELLAIAIYTEVGGCCEDCYRYVGDVILNRVNDSRFPDTIYGVLTQRGQYAAFGNGVKWPSRAKNAGESEAVQLAYSVAEELLEGIHSKLYGNNYIWQAQFKQGTGGFWCCGEYYGKG